MWKTSIYINTIYETNSCNTSGSGKYNSRNRQVSNEKGV